MKNCMKFFSKALLGAMLVAPAVTSCYDDSAIWDKFDDIENRIDSLANELNKQVEALNVLVKDGAVIADCVENKDGSYTVTLTNGTSFKVMPEGTDFSTIVTYKEINGVKYWATFDSDGVAEVLTDPTTGKTIPMETKLEVKLVDGVYYLVINGTEYPTGYDASDVVQVFSSCTPLVDASGNTYAVKFTLGEGMEVTVALDGYAGVIFRLPGATNPMVAEYYVEYGTVQSFLLDMEGVIDYVMQVPDGWRVKERVVELTSETYLDVTAPSRETVALGAAEVQGDLKLVSVVEGGKASVSKLSLSADPFKKYDVSALKAVIEPYEGIQKFVYGLMLYKDYDKATVIETVNEILGSASDAPEGYFVSEEPIDKTYAEIYGSELSEDSSYMFWVVPALYSEGNDGTEAGFYVKEEMFNEYLLNNIVDASINISDISLLDAQVSVKVTGTNTVYAGVSLKSTDLLEELVYQINNGVYEPRTDILEYSGPVSTFPSKEEAILIEPDQKYVVWVLPVDPEKKEVAVTDIITAEFSTPAVVSGGSAKLDATDFEVTPSSIKTQLSSDDAVMIYYAYLSDAYGRYASATNETKMKYLMQSENFKTVRGSSVEAVLDRLQPETTMWLFAAAIDKNGQYGDVYAGSAKTGSVKFNSLKVELTDVAIGSNEATFKVDVTGGTAVDYVYWVGKETDPFWYDSGKCNKTKLVAQKYIAANPDAPEVEDVMKKNGPIAEDGTLTAQGLSVETTYILVVLAKDEEGLYSQAGYKKFKTQSINLGDYATEGSDRWNAAKEKVVVNWHQDKFRAAANSNMSAFYEFDITIPKEFTAYIYCISETYFEEAGLDTPAKMIYDIVTYCSRKYDANRVPHDENGEYLVQPEWVDDKGETHAGQLINLYDFYVHGFPTNGFATYFAEGAHIEDNCFAWEDGACSNYEHAKNSIAKRLTLEYWIDWVKLNRGYYLWEEESIRRVAQDLMDAYYPYYKDAEPLIYINDGSSLLMQQHYASGVDTEGNVVDDVYVVLKDKSNNFYAPMIFDVPNYF